MIHLRYTTLAVSLENHHLAAAPRRDHQIPMSILIDIGGDEEVGAHPHIDKSRILRERLHAVDHAGEGQLRTASLHGDRATTAHRIPCDQSSVGVAKEVACRHRNGNSALRLQLFGQRKLSSQALRESVGRQEAILSRGLGRLGCGGQAPKQSKGGAWEERLQEIAIFQGAP